MLHANSENKIIIMAIMKYRSTNQHFLVLKLKKTVRYLRTLVLHLTKTDQLWIIWVSSDFHSIRSYILISVRFCENLIFSHQVKWTDIQNISKKGLFKLMRKTKQNKKNSSWKQCSTASVTTSISFSIYLGRTKNKHIKPLNGFL